MAVTLGTVTRPVTGTAYAPISAMGTYATGGISINASSFALAMFQYLNVQTSGGYICQPIVSTGGQTALLKMYAVAASATSSQTTSTKVIRLYAGTITGTVKTPYASITLSQAVSGATATVQGYSATSPAYFQITPTGTFNASNVVTGTNADASTFTFTPTMTAVDAWTLGTAATAIYFAFTNTGQALTQVTSTTLLAANQIRQPSSTVVETLTSGGWTSITAGYFPSAGAVLTELPNGFDLSSVTASVQAFGY